MEPPSRSRRTVCLVEAGPDYGPFDGSLGPPTSSRLREWASPGWDFDSIEPYLRRAERTISTRPLVNEELGPWARAVREAAPEAGVPVLDDFNDLSSPEGAAYVPVNANGFARWNTAFAYLDGARPRENLTVMGDALE